MNWLPFTQDIFQLNKCVGSALPAACQTLGAANAVVPPTSNELAKNLCARLFADQEVLQSACRSRCADHFYSSAGDAQECAFKFAHTSRDVAPPTVDDHTVLWSVVFIVVLIPAVMFAYRRVRKTPK
jgi:hypothetical protein